AAQGVSNITYGGSVTGTLSAEAPLNLYVFSGNAGDVVTAEVHGLEPGMAPTISLLAPTQQVLAGSAVEQLGAGGSTATITRILPSAGVYTLLVGGTPGQYLVTLDGSAAPASAPLTVPSNTNLALAGDGAAQVFSVANGSTGPVALSVGGGSAQ